MSRSSVEITVGDRGRIMLPSAVRRALGLEPGMRLLLTTEDDGSLRLQPFSAIVSAGLGVLADVAPQESLVDELLAERRAAAAAE